MLTIRTKARLMNAIARTGRAREARPELEHRGDLGTAELSLVLSPPKGLNPHARIEKIRFAHHQLARVLASGAKVPEASLVTGYSPGRIAILKADPAFQELMSYYTEQKEEIFLDAQRRLAALGATAVEILQERLEEAPDKVETRLVKEVAEFALDRSVTKSPAKAGAALTIKFVTPERAGPTIEGVVLDVTESGAGT